MNDQILVALSSFAVDDSAPLRMLEASGYPFLIHSTGKRITTNELVDIGKNATVIIAGVEPYDASTLAQLPSLRCISRLGVGVDAIDLKEAERKNITVTNTPDIPTTAVAELALTMMLSLSRNIHVQANLMHEKRWERVSAHLLSGRTVGLVGLGRIGQRVAKLCAAFGAKLIAFDPFIAEHKAKEAGVQLVDKHQLVSNADIISLHASKTEGNKVILGEAEFTAMKKGAIVINLARGEMIDEDALVTALTEGKVSGVGLDVFSSEPYQGPLCDFKQVILTPHCATLTMETRSAMEMQSVENALAFLAGNIPADRHVI